MEITKKEQAARRAALTRLETHLRRHPVLAGTLAKVARGGTFRYQLTDRPGGKARILYVPADMAGEVEKWTENWRKAKALLLALSELTSAEMRRRGPDRGRSGTGATSETAGTGGQTSPSAAAREGDRPPYRERRPSRKAVG